MKRIAIFSDIHSNLEALETIINDINKSDYDEVICLGDVLAIGPSPRECLDLIIKNNVHMLLGNHELYYIHGTGIDDDMTEIEKEHQKWVASNLSDKHKKYLEDCNLGYYLRVNNYSLGFKHFLINKSSPDDYPFYSILILKNGEINKIIKEEICDLLFIGHEHIAGEINIDSKKIIDVGSSGCRKDNKTYYTILTINDDNYFTTKRELTYDRDKFLNKMNNINYPEKDFLSKIFFGIN